MTLALIGEATRRSNSKGWDFLGIGDQSMHSERLIRSNDENAEDVHSQLS